MPRLISRWLGRDRSWLPCDSKLLWFLQHYFYCKKYWKVSETSCIVQSSVVFRTTNAAIWSFIHTTMFLAQQCRITFLFIVITPALLADYVVMGCFVSSKMQMQFSSPNSGLFIACCSFAPGLLKPELSPCWQSTIVFQGVGWMMSKLCLIVHNEAITGPIPCCPCVILTTETKERDFEWKQRCWLCCS